MERTSGMQQNKEEISVCETCQKDRREEALHQSQATNGRQQCPKCHHWVGPREVSWCCGPLGTYCPACGYQFEDFMPKEAESERVEREAYYVKLNAFYARLGQRIRSPLGFGVLAVGVILLGLVFFS